jgi:hypothetical protein
MHQLSGEVEVVGRVKRSEKSIPGAAKSKKEYVERYRRARRATERKMIM